PGRDRRIGCRAWALPRGWNPELLDAVQEWCSRQHTPVRPRSGEGATATLTCMTSDARAGRPRASSRETLAEAACELFLEKGYEATSIVDIAQRAGVSRSSFFNYFASKSDVLWSGLDARIATASVALASLGTAADGPAVRGALEPI